MSKLRVIGLVAGAMMIASPALADTTNTTDSEGLAPTGGQITRALAGMTATGIGSRVGNFLSPQVFAEQGVDAERAALFADSQQGTGMAAGGGDGRLGVWVSGNWTQIEDELSSTAYDGDLYSALVGADYQFNDRFLGGIALGYESADIDTKFNTGSIEADGFTIAPYAGYVLNRYLTVDVAGGYTFADYDLSRTTAGGIVTGSTEGDRWFVGGNLNAYYAVNRVTLGGRVGYLYTKENQDAFTESNSTANSENDISIGQFRVGGTVGYQLGKVEPYVTGTYVYDAQQEKIVVSAAQAAPKNDRSGIDVGGGIRFALSDRVTGGFEGTTHVGRDDYDSTSLTGNLRIKF
jgi:outer membrane autotransporter protein